MKRFEINKGIIILATSLFAAGWLIVLAIFLFMIFDQSPPTPLVLHKVEELDLVFFSYEESSLDFKPYHEHTIFFSDKEDRLLNREECNYIHFKDATDSLELNDPDFRARVLFCQINETVICVVCEGTIFKSVDYPIVTYDSKGVFSWGKKEYIISDIPYIAVFLSVDEHKKNKWDAYRYNPHMKQV